MVVKLGFKRFDEVKRAVMSRSRNAAGDTVQVLGALVGLFFSQNGILWGDHPLLRSGIAAFSPINTLYEARPCLKKYSF